MATGLDSIELTQREGLPHEIARKLIAYLLSGDIKPGTRMPSERALAAALGVGRSSVREALKSLGLLGLVEVRQGDGTYLRRPDSDLLPQVIEWGLLLNERRTLDLVDARQHLEIINARLAAQRRTPADIKALNTALRLMSKRSNPDAFVEADIAFHLAVAEAAQNAVMLDIVKSIQSLLKVWIKRAVTEAGETRGSHEEHVPVLEAIVAGDADAAGAAMAEHMSRAAERLRRSVDADMSRGAARS
jgi:GntR family transcriptional regulator, transcriptional repressor for pyruvate dehydrogenase complex